MQTHEWEALLEGAAPGPWAGIADEDTTCITTPDGVLIDVDEHWSSCSEADVRLAAHAPAAVAEVIRLRKDINAMRDRMRNTAKVFTHKDLGRCNPHADMAIDLTRILEGEA